MPFSKTKNHDVGYWKQHYEKYLKILIESNNKIKAERSKPIRGNVINEIIKKLVTSKIVIADLTDYNSNVFWELGVRQSFKYGTITIAEEGTKLPFNLSVKGTLFYNSNHSENSEFEKDFKLAINDCITNPERPDSSVLETMSGRGTLFEIIQKDETIRRLEGLLFELDRNYFVLDDTRYIIAKNRLRANKLIATDRIRLRAADLLLSSRYVKVKEDFYDKINAYWIDFNSFNSVLEKWDDKNYEIYEKWFDSRKKKLYKRYEETKVYIERINDEIKNRN